MAQDSKVEWCQHTANIWIGCVEVHAGCDNCYARVLNHRWGHENWGNKTPRRMVNKVWSDLARFQKLAAEKNEVHRVFVGSMMDIFEKPMPVINSKGELQNFDTDYLRQEFFNNVIPACPNLMFLLLTKRPSNIRKYIPASWQFTFPKNVMLGTSPVNQKTADKLCTQLLESVDDGNAQFFLSVEPQLAQIDLNQWLYNRYVMGGARPMFNQVNWVICGGESGHGRRPFNTDWARLLKHQCEQAKVPFFFKQIDKVYEKTHGIPEDLQIRQFPEMANSFLNSEDAKNN